MTKPTIHTNGSNGQELADGYYAAMQAVSDAMEKVGTTHPNGRDYYPQGDNACTSAQTEHQTRMRKLEEVRQELETLCIHCQDIEDEKKARIAERARQ